MATQTYQYTPLTTAPQQFRILHILPGTWTDPIACELHTALLDSPPVYKTLSYVWGDPNITKTIKIHDCDFEVTVSLYGALRRFRMRKEVFVIWVDALCINQMDVGERGSQVEIMGRVYKRCSEVWIWWGEAGDLNYVAGVEKRARAAAEVKGGLSEKVGIVQKISQKYRSLRDRLNMRNKVKGVKDVKELLNEAEVEIVNNVVGDTKTVEQAGDLPWFRIDEDGTESLVWEVLENFDFKNDNMLAAFAVISILESDRHFKDMPCFAIVDEALGEPKHIAFTDRYRGANSGMETLADLPYWNRIWVIQELALPPAVNVIYGSQKAPWKIFAQDLRHTSVHAETCCLLDPKGLSGLNSIPYSTHYLFGLRVQSMPVLQSNTQSGTRIDMIVLMRTLFLHKATNPLDKIYGVLGLTGVPLKADYTLTRQELSTRLTLSLIEQAGSLRALIGGGIFRNDQFPSWVLDWTQEWKESDETLQMTIHQMYQTQGTSSEAYSASLQTRARAECVRDVYLLVHGVHVDTILQIFDARELAFNDGVRKIDGEYRAGGSLGDACRRTLCGDMLLDVRAANAGLFVRQAKDNFVEEDVNGIAPMEVEFAVTTAICGRNYFITDTGYVGLGPVSMDVGDQVWVCHGSDMPFVLRKMDVPDVKIDDKDETGFPVLKLMGECYMHGIMDGEIMEIEGLEILRLALG